MVKQIVSGCPDCVHQKTLAVPWSSNCVQLTDLVPVNVDLAVGVHRVGVDEADHGALDGRARQRQLQAGGQFNRHIRFRVGFRVQIRGMFEDNFSTTVPLVLVS